MGVLGKNGVVKAQPAFEFTIVLVACSSLSASTLAMTKRARFVLGTRFVPVPQVADIWWLSVQMPSLMHPRWSMCMKGQRYPSQVARGSSRVSVIPCLRLEF